MSKRIAVLLAVVALTFLVSSAAPAPAASASAGITGQPAPLPMACTYSCKPCSGVNHFKFCSTCNGVTSCGACGLNCPI